MNESQPDLNPEPIGRFDWERIVRRAVIKPPSVKLLGLVMATYANADGTRVRPGQQRLANVMGTSISTVERGQRALEALGFIQMTYKGHSAGRGRPGGYASEYRLTIPSDLFERIPMLDPDESHPSPMKGNSSKDPAPMTGNSEPDETREPSRHSRESDPDSEEIPVNPKETPVTGAETPVNSEDSPVTHDGPPDHYHQIKDQYINHQSTSVALSDARARELARVTERTEPLALSMEENRRRQLDQLEAIMAANRKKAS